LIQKNFQNFNFSDAELEPIAKTVCQKFFVDHNFIYGRLIQEFIKGDLQEFEEFAGDAELLQKVQSMNAVITPLHKNAMKYNAKPPHIIRCEQLLKCNLHLIRKNHQALSLNKLSTELLKITTQQIEEIENYHEIDIAEKTKWRMVANTVVSG